MGKIGESTVEKEEDKVQKEEDASLKAEDKTEKAESAALKLSAKIDAQEDKTLADSIKAAKDMKNHPDLAKKELKKAKEEQADVDTLEQKAGMAEYKIEQGDPKDVKAE